MHGLHRFKLCVLFGLGLFAFALATSVDLPPKDAGIAVIGRDANAVFIVHSLLQRGYDNIHLYDHSSFSNAAHQKKDIGGHGFEWFSRYIAADTIDGPGVEAGLRDFLESYSIDLQPAEPIVSWAGSTHLDPRPDFLKQFSKEILTNDLINGYKLIDSLISELKDTDLPWTAASLVSLNITLPDETFEQFALRTKLPAFTTLLASIHEALSGTPSSDLPAASVLAGRLFDFPSWFKYALQIESDPFASAGESGAPGSAAQLIGSGFSKPYYILANGLTWSDVLDRIARENQLSVHFGEQISSIGLSSQVLPTGSEASGPQAGQERPWIISSTSSEFRFDFIFLAEVSPELVSLLPRSITISSLLQQTSWSSVRQWMYRCFGWPMSTPAVPFPSAATVLLQPCSNKIGSNWPEEACVLSIQRQHPYSDVILASTRLSATFSDADADLLFNRTLPQYGLLVTEKLLNITRHVPAHTSTATWNKQMAMAQGADGLFVFGHLQSGSDAHSSYFTVSSAVNRHFADYGSTRGKPSDSSTHFLTPAVAYAFLAAMLGLLAGVCITLVIIKRRRHAQLQSQKYNNEPSVSTGYQGLDDERASPSHTRKLNGDSKSAPALREFDQVYTGADLHTLDASAPAHERAAALASSLMAAKATTFGLPPTHPDTQSAPQEQRSRGGPTYSPEPEESLDSESIASRSSQAASLSVDSVILNAPNSATIQPEEQLQQFNQYL